MSDDVDGVGYLTELLRLSDQGPPEKPARPNPDDPMGHLPGPWFVGCVRSDCEADVYGPLVTWEDTLKESGVCHNAHLVSMHVAESTYVNVPQALGIVWGREQDRWVGEHNLARRALQIESEQ